MIGSIFELIFIPFSFEPVLYCCGFFFVAALFGLIRRFLISDYSFGR